MLVVVGVSLALTGFVPWAGLPTATAGAGPVHRPTRRPDTTVMPHSEFAVRTPNSLWTATPQGRSSANRQGHL
ncbi:hypothetical protein GCM10009779_13480 [Polymorphospora rubra]|uniref:Uncharacterized protein n=1 Tax=Polymorphospora rubra TaxID=338584 RepID=A0A810MSU0_9ACTN|nr:hypothetical protein Prubr_13170 [Polymorphospora rubra]